MGHFQVFDKNHCERRNRIDGYVKNSHSKIEYSNGEPGRSRRHYITHICSSYAGPGNSLFLESS
jgi:hypothetical protein